MDRRQSPTIEEMATIDGTSETSHLVSSASSSKPSYINVVSNICSLLYVGIIMYCCFKDDVTLFSFHPLLMSIGWLVGMTSAINSVTPGDLATDWMPIRLRSARHWFLQILSGIIILTGFFVILSNKIIHDKSHFATLHAKFGLASIIFSITTGLGGICVLGSLKLKDYIAPIYTKILHASFGLLTFVLGIITIILGNFSNWWNFGEILRYTGLVLILLVMLFTILRPMLKIYFRLKEKLFN